MSDELRSCPLCGKKVSIARADNEQGERWWFVTRGPYKTTRCNCRLFLESEKFACGWNDVRALECRRKLIERWNARANDAGELPTDDACEILRRNLYDVGDLGRAMGILEPNELVGGSGDRAYIFERLADLIERDYVRKPEQPQVIKNAEKYKLADDSGPQVITNAEKHELADSREKLEADVHQAADDMEMLYCGEKFLDTRKIISWLDRQAAITRAEVFEDGEYDFMFDELTAERDHFRKHVNHLMALIADIARKQPHTFDPEAPYMTLDTIGDYLDELQDRVDGLTAELDKANESGGKLLDKLIDMTAERDKLDEDCSALDKRCIALEERVDSLTAERDQLKKELKQAHVEWESERDYADQCEERLVELTGETDREENGMTKKKLKKDYKRLLKQIDELDERIDKERPDTEDYRLMMAMYFTMCAIEGRLRHRIETM